MPQAFLEVELTGAGVVDTINRAGEKGIILYGVQWCADLSVRFRVTVTDYFLLSKLAAKQGDELVVLSKRGLRFWVLSVIKRPLLIGALLLVTVLSVWLPGRVLFVAVEGNEGLDSKLVLQTAEECGIYFGAKRVDVRSEKVKNMLLEKLPQLQWAGVNTYGCTALVSVREDVARKEQGNDVQYSNVVACRDGVVLSVTATSGLVQCKVGDAVKEGQVLISGKWEEGIIGRYTRSEGEIYAQTRRSCTVVTPTVYTKKTKAESTVRNFSLLIGKNRINLSKDSGIYYAGYDRIYVEYSVVLPGGFTLPFGLAVEEYVSYRQESAVAEDTESLVVTAAEWYVMEQMNAGKVLARNYYREPGSDAYKLVADYFCTEMIGCERNEELEFFNGQDRGTNGER